ncbi:hypothetical protein RD055328_02300 [Companilactobacillus sp. RD055328]|uniref:DUF1934 domain-containing protein n=1 Tax=Companilactobacillus sp. RD055328 TaxID=2916634 RepID=UPI001FC7D082|nr:DUF1934 domain-containing protein [Companilactobacillus sp. RD055328]GKQ42307.1 hypothetical protein RD055328_02300 [Companilactobacillus sp. RD055328]
MNETQKVDIKLTTTIKQDNEDFEHSIENSGIIEEKDDRFVLNFIDENEEGRFFIRFDLLKTGEVLLNRQSSDQQNMSDFYFKEKEQKEVIYKTSYGVMSLVAQTTYLLSDIDNGQVEIDYLLFQQKQLVGEYKLRLIFSAVIG